MLIKELLYEDKYLPEKVSSDPVWLANFIKTNCKEWLSQTNNGEYYVYRGVKLETRFGDNIKAFVKNTREDRKPKDSSKLNTRLLNDLIELVGGKANRTNSVFVTRQHSQAMQYGRIYVYIPIGPFNFTWSPVWKDWYVNFDKIDLAENATKSQEEFSKDPELTKRFSNYHTYINRVHEMFVAGTVDVSLLDIERLHDYIKTTDLKAAITAHKEIMIQASQGLYIEPLLYEDVLSNL